MTISFKISGKRHELTYEMVIQAVTDIEPEPIRLHSVFINDTWFPLKQVFAIATQLDRLDFTTNQARTQLKRLGFEVKRQEES